MISTAGFYLGLFINVVGYSEIIGQQDEYYYQDPARPYYPEIYEKKPESNMCHWFTPILIIGIVLFVLVIVLLFQYCNVQRKADLSSITDAIQTSPPYQSKDKLGTKKQLNNAVNQKNLKVNNNAKASSNGMKDSNIKSTGAFIIDMGQSKNRLGTVNDGKSIGKLDTVNLSELPMTSTNGEKLVFEGVSSTPLIIASGQEEQSRTNRSLNAIMNENNKLTFKMDQVQAQNELTNPNETKIIATKFTTIAPPSVPRRIKEKRQTNEDSVVIKNEKAKGFDNSNKTIVSPSQEPLVFYTECLTEDRNPENKIDFRLNNQPLQKSKSSTLTSIVDDTKTKSRFEPSVETIAQKNLPKEKENKNLNFSENASDPVRKDALENLKLSETISEFNIECKSTNTNIEKEFVRKVTSDKPIPFVPLKDNMNAQPSSKPFIINVEGDRDSFTDASVKKINSTENFQFQTDEIRADLTNADQNFINSEKNSGSELKLSESIPKISNKQNYLRFNEIDDSIELSNKPITPIIKTNIKDSQHEPIVCTYEAKNYMEEVKPDLKLSENLLKSSRKLEYVGLGKTDNATKLPISETISFNKQDATNLTVSIKGKEKSDAKHESTNNNGKMRETTISDSQNLEEMSTCNYNDSSNPNDNLRKTDEIAEILLNPNDKSSITNTNETKEINECAECRSYNNVLTDNEDPQLQDYKVQKDDLISESIVSKNVDNNDSLYLGYNNNESNCNYSALANKNEEIQVSKIKLTSNYQRKKELSDNSKRKVSSSNCSENVFLCTREKIRETKCQKENSMAQNIAVRENNYKTNIVAQIETSKTDIHSDTQLKIDDETKKEIQIEKNGVRVESSTKSNLIEIEYQRSKTSSQVAELTLQNCTKDENVSDKYSFKDCLYEDNPNESQIGKNSSEVRTVNTSIDNIQYSNATNCKECRELKIKSTSELKTFDQIEIKSETTQMLGLQSEACTERNEKLVFHSQDLTSNIQLMGYEAECETINKIRPIDEVTPKITKQECVIDSDNVSNMQVFDNLKNNINTQNESMLENNQKTCKPIVTSETIAETMQEKLDKDSNSIIGFVYENQNDEDINSQENKISVTQNRKPDAKYWYDIGGGSNDIGDSNLVLFVGSRQKPNREVPTHGKMSNTTKVASAEKMSSEQNIETNDNAESPWFVTNSSSNTQEIDLKLSNTKESFKVDSDTNNFIEQNIDSQTNKDNNKLPGVEKVDLKSDNSTEESSEGTLAAFTQVDLRLSNDTNQLSENRLKEVDLDSSKEKSTENKLNSNELINKEADLKLFNENNNYSNNKFILDVDLQLSKDAERFSDNKIQSSLVAEQVDLKLNKENDKPFVSTDNNLTKQGMQDVDLKLSNDNEKLFEVDLSQQATQEIDLQLGVDNSINTLNNVDLQLSGSELRPIISNGNQITNKETENLVIRSNPKSVTFATEESELSSKIDEQKFVLSTDEGTFNVEKQSSEVKLKTKAAFLDIQSNKTYMRYNTDKQAIGENYV